MAKWACSPVPFNRFLCSASSELYYLIARFLQSGPCNKSAQVRGSRWGDSGHGPTGEIKAAWCAFGLRVRARPALTISCWLLNREGGRGQWPEPLLISMFPFCSGASAGARGASGMVSLCGEVGRVWAKTGGRGGQVRVRSGARKAWIWALSYFLRLQLPTIYSLERGSLVRRGLNSFTL